MSSSSSDSESESTDKTPPPKKLKACKGAATYGTKYNPRWQTDFPFVSGCQNDPYSFYCNVCQKDVSCRHQGVSDLKRHEKSTGYQTMTRATSGSTRLDTMGFVPVGSALDTQVCNI